MSIWTKEKEITTEKEYTVSKEEIVQELRAELGSMVISVLNEDDTKCERHGFGTFEVETTIGRFRSLLAKKLSEEVEHIIAEEAGKIIQGEDFLDRLVTRIKDKQL